VQLYNYLTDAGMDVDVLSRTLETEGPVEPRFNLEPIEVGHSGFDFRTVRVLRDRIRRREYDLVQANTSTQQLHLNLATRGLSLKRCAYRGAFGRSARYQPKAWLTYRHRALDKILCVSGAIHRQMEQDGIDPRKLITVHKGHDVGWYRAHPRAALEQYGVPGNEFVVGFLGHMNRTTKGADVLIEAIALLPPTLPIHVLFIGPRDDEMIRRFVDHPHWRDRVHYLGFRKDGASILGACDVAAFPSRADGFPRALIEGMSQGVPAVVSDSGGMTEVVTDRQNGLIVPTQDPAALSQAIQLLYDDRELVRRYGENARATIADEFSVERFCEKTLAVYDDLLDLRSGSAGTG
jgi:glycosyltransferase involved in cell wall biosynthesis